MIVLMIMITVLFVTYFLGLLMAEKAKSKLDSIMDDYLSGGDQNEID